MKDVELIWQRIREKELNKDKEPVRVGGFDVIHDQVIHFVCDEGVWKLLQKGLGRSQQEIGLILYDWLKDLEEVFPDMWVENRSGREGLLHPLRQDGVFSGNDPPKNFRLRRCKTGQLKTALRTQENQQFKRVLSV